MVGYTDLLLGESIGILGTTQRKYLERIKLSTERLGRLVDDLVQASLAESDPERVERGEVDVSQLAQETLLEARRKAEMRHVVIKSHVPRQKLVIDSDARMLRRVFAQLLHNASTVTPESGEVKLSVKLESSEGEIDYVMLQVSDTGGGIAAEDLPRVFAPSSGNIAGLSNVDFLRLKTLVEVLGGRIWVDSEPGKGSTFSVLVPTTLESPQEAGEEGAA
jgi:signal transduction histidine kinase